MTFTEAVRELALKDPFTHEPVTPSELIETLKADVVFALQRPGSWEGANMLVVLQSHGFFNDYEG